MKWENFVARLIFERMPKIREIVGREILDSRGNPTIEVRLTLDDGIVGIGKVPSGASTGTHEALEMRDYDMSRFFGKGVLNACKNVNEIIAPELRGKEAIDQQKIDTALVALDGTENKSRLGANAILGVSLAVAHAVAKALGKPLYEYIAAAYNFSVFPHRFPNPMFNILNGGKHAENHLNVQEFMIVPYGVDRFSEKVRAGAEVFHALKDILRARKMGTGIGDEGGFTPEIERPEDALFMIAEAIEHAGYNFDQIGIALDIAASEFYEKRAYHLEPSSPPLTAVQLTERYQSWVKEFPLISLEDPFHEDDWKAWQDLSFLSMSFESTSAFLENRSLMVVGDDLFVTHRTRLEKGIAENAANAILIKPNQIGTISETIECIHVAKKHHYDVIISHRSGETCDATIADLCVAVGAGFIKAGAPSRGERVAKYNRVMEIEREIGL